MSKVKFQHYVPRFYLRQFCFKVSKSTGYTYCYDKFDSKVRPNNINRVAGQNYFFDDSGSPVQPIESGLSKLESKFKPTYKKLCKFENLNLLSYNEKRITSLYIVTQETRTFEMRESLRSGLSLLRESIESRGVELTSEQKDEFEEALTEGSLRDMQRETLKDIPDFASILFHMKWMLIRNTFDVPFWTSDHPVVRWNDEDHRFYGNLGYLSSGIQIFFPLTPRLCLSFVDPVKYASLPPIAETPILNNVIHQNWLQLISSTRHIFSINKDFSLAEEYLTKYPELKDPDRPRHKVT